MSWEILDTGLKTAEENMQIDVSLLDQLATRDRPLLHLYDWAGKPATFGHLTTPSLFLDIDAVEKEQISLAKRPTGGGILFHIWDFAFSVLIPSTSSLCSPNTLDNYALINNIVVRIVEEFMGKSLNTPLLPHDMPPRTPSCKRFCMAQPTKYDVVYQGKKIAGAAQRKTKAGFLHQGTISLMFPDFTLIERILLPHSQVGIAMKENTFALLDKETSPKEYISARQKIKNLFSLHCTQL